MFQLWEKKRRSQSRYEFEKSQDLTCVADVLNIYKKQRISQALVIRVIIETSIEVQEIRDFIDCDAKRCFISQSLAIDTKFFDD